MKGVVKKGWKTPKRPPGANVPDKSHRLNGLFFPNATSTVRPDPRVKASADQPENKPDKSTQPQEHLSVIPANQSNLCPNNNMPVAQSVRKKRVGLRATRNNALCWDFATARNIIEFRHQVKKLLNLLDFSDFFFQRLPWVEKAKQPFGTLPSQLLAIYKQERLFEHDLALQHVKSTTSPVFMSSIENFIFDARIKSDTFHRYNQLISISRRFGYHDVYYIPLKAKDGQCNVMLSVTTRDMNSTDFKRQVEAHKAELHLLAQAIYYNGTQRFPFLFLGTQKRQKLIHPRPLQLLNVLAKDDLALNQAADKLSITIDTANKHIAAVKSALGVRTQAAAVYSAIKAGLIN